ncbi:MAG: hypothetical protein GY947_11780 [Rhodobacteraceae bacterium]|nr:hypothetical protein [Paracoccaceae bacterium]
MLPKPLKSLALIPALAAALLLTACETTEQRSARLTQHNGKTVEQVMATLGSPISRTKTQAIWEHRDSYVVRHPIQEFWNGRWVLVGFDNQVVNQHCILTANLQRGIVVSSEFHGTGCVHLVPFPPNSRL